MNYLVIDLEMCKVPKMYRKMNYKHANETIQVGAVLLNEQFQQIASISQYVHPEYGIIDSFITKLTGIQRGHVKHAPKLNEVLAHLMDWIGEREFQIFAWSDTDYEQLAREVKSKGIEDSKVLDFMNSNQWIDYQKVFGERFGYKRAVGLEEALMLCNIHADGRFHDGLADALNTAKIIRKLEENPQYEIQNYEKDMYLSDEPLNFCLGDLFAGVKLFA